MAKYNLENYLEKDGLGFPLNFRRGNPNPLDNSSVWKSYAEALNYAQTDPTAYVGQIISVVNYTAAVTDEEGTVVTPSQSTVEVYYIKDEAGNLEQVGTAPVGDEKSIVVAEDGTISVKGVDALVFERDILGEDDQPTGEKETVQYQPLMTKDGLVWVEPSKTTVEGLATLIDALTKRVDDVEDAIEALEGVVGKAAEGEAEATGLIKKIADLEAADAAEIAIREEAVTAIGNRISDVEELIGAVTEGKTVVKMIEEAQEAATYDDTELAGRVKAIEDDHLVAEDKTELENAIKTISDDYLKAADKTALQGAIDLKANTADLYTKTEIDTAVKGAEDAAVDRVLGYLAEEEVNTSYDTLKEVAAWIESDTTNSAALINRVTAIENDYLKGADKTELQGAIDDFEEFVGTLPEGVASTTVVAYIQEVVDALQIGDYAKTADLTKLAERVTTLEGEMDVVEGKVSTIEGQITTIGENIDAVEEDITEINEALKGKVDVVEGSRLMADAEGAKLEAIEAGAQVNKIETVSAEFDLADKHLTVKAIEQGKVTGLTDALAGKVDKIEGSRLLTEDEATKLEKLVLGENGEVSVSGKVAAGNVEGLEAWITARAASLEGLSENNFTDAMVAKLNGVAEGAQVNVIDAVSEEFVIAADGKVLSIKAVAQDKVTGLADTLAGKVDVVEGKGLSTNDLTDELVAKINAAEANFVKSVSDEFVVDEAGKLAVGTINVNKLVQTDGEFLILNGGNAGLNA